MSEIKTLSTGEFKIIEDQSKKFNINNVDVRCGFYQNKIYINLSDLCKAGNKKYKHWKELDKTQEFLDILSQELQIPKEKLICRKHGVQASERGSYGHPQIAIDIAYWISPTFRVKIINWINELVGLEKCFSTLNECIKKDPPKQKNGYIYCLTAEILKEYTYSIGCSKLEQSELVDSYKRAYGKPEVLLYYAVNDRYAAEDYIKKRLHIAYRESEIVIDDNFENIKHVFDEAKDGFN